MSEWKQLKHLLKEIHLLQSINGVLSWDQQTFLPQKGASLRSEQISFLSQTSHQKIVSTQFGEQLDICEETAETITQKRCVSEWKKMRNKKLRLPKELVSALSTATSNAINAWAQSKKNNDFTTFAPHLERLIDLSRQKAQCYDISPILYDNLLDDYDPSVTTAQLNTIFSSLQAELSPLIKEYSRAETTNIGYFSTEELNQINNKLIRSLGFNLDAGRLDISAHPFTLGLNPNDVRLTTHHNTENLLGSIGGTIHECGHGLYEQNLPIELEELGLCSAPGAGIHESQSRFYENIIGRSFAFSKWLATIIKDIRGTKNSPTATELYLAGNPVQPSLIRIESDETTYNLHIIIRFQLEQALLNKEISVKEAPDFWKEAYRSSLGIVPTTHKEGILQDIHWSLGYFGYFPSYTIGNLYAASYKKHLVQQIPDIWEQVEQGHFHDILAWLKTNIHAKGNLFSQEEIVRQAVGTTNHVQNLIEHFQQRQQLALSLRNHK